MVIDVQCRHLILLFSENKEYGLDEFHHPQTHGQPAVIDRVVSMLVFLDGQLGRASSDEAKFESDANILEIKARRKRTHNGIRMIEITFPFGNNAV